MDESRLFILDTPAKRDRLISLLGKLPLDGRIWDVSVKPYQARRSVDANRRLWALHKIAAEATGHSTEELHEWCKAQFLPRTVIEVGGKKREISGSSAKLSKRDFMAFMEAVEAFYISELGVFLGQE